MKLDEVIQAREQAEKAVAAMPEGPLKTKAFEVILGRLLGDMETAEIRVEQKLHSDRQEIKSATKRIPTSVSQRILTVREDGFFREQRSIGEIRSALRQRGWHYPLTTLSGRLVELVQRGMLRRELMKEGSKKIWKYSNP